MKRIDMMVAPTAMQPGGYVPVAYADTPPMLWPLAAMSLEAHLVKLQREGRIEKQTTGNYRCTMAS